MILLAGIAFLITSAYTLQAIINWKIETEQSRVKFIMQAHGQELIGKFDGVKGEVVFDTANLSRSFFNCNISVATISTGNEIRDEHLQDTEFFGASEFPVINFTSAKISPTEAGYKAEGTLSAKGISKQIEIPFTFSGDQATGVFKGSFSMKRSDFGIGQPDAELGDEVVINLEVPVSKSE